MYYDNISIYQIWAPDDSVWSAWAKPVLFTNISSHRSDRFTEVPLIPPDAPMLPESGMAVIIDLPGEQSVIEALSFAAHGFRPVPLYNGVHGPGKLLVDVREISETLYEGTDIMRRIHLNSDAPPVFMLDSNRMNGVRSPGHYDNRWCVFEQDLPSADYLKSCGIFNLTVRIQQVFSRDLERILYEYQKSGITLYALCDGSNTARETMVRKNSFGSTFGYRFGVMFGLKRNSTGGFGQAIPEPYEYSGSSHYGGGYRYRYRHG